MFDRIHIIAAVIAAAAVTAPASGAAAQQPAPSTLVRGAPADSAHGTVTALGIERDARSLGVAQQTVRGDAMTASGETNLISALAGRVAGADVSGTGASGTSVRLLLRGARTGAGDDQPLFVLDGVPLANQSITGIDDDDIDYGSTLGDVDLNDVAAVTILDGPNAAALYGSRARNGAVLITTKSASGARGFSLTARQDFTFESPVRLPQLQNRFALGSNGVYSAGGIGTWGPAVYGTDQVQWWSNGEAAPLIAQPDILRDFLVQGHTATTSAAVSAAGSDADIRLGITNVGEDGVVPNSALSRLSTSLSAGVQPLPRFTIRVDGQYAHAHADHQPVEGASADNALEAFLFAGTGIDVAHLRTDALTNHDDAFGRASGVNNPYWDAYVNSNASDRDHAIGAISASYGFAPWLSASIRTGIDWWHDHQVQGHPNTGGLFESDAFDVTGGTTYREQNSDLLVSVARPLGASLAMTVDAGVATRGGHAGEVVAVDDNGATGRVTDLSSRVQTNSVMGRSSISFDSTVFLDATGRKDWTRIGAEFFPSLSAAWDLVHDTPNGKLGGVVSAGKLRASWAQVGGEDFEALDRTTSWEGGVDLGMVRDRVSLSATYYAERTLSHVIDALSLGFPTLRPLAVTDRGIEVALGATAVKRADGTQWDIGLRFGSNRSRVQGSQGSLELGGLGTHAALVVGQPVGTIVAEVPVRDSLGRPILYGGLPVLQPAPLGSELPSWVGGLESDLRFKQFSLMVLVDSRHGGHVYSETNLWGTLLGTLQSTLGLRRHGETIADGGGIILPGVNQDGTPNTTPVSPQVYAEDDGQIAAFTVYDASAIDLREVRLGYSVQTSLAARLHLTTLEVAAIARNLWTHAAAPNFDPQSVFDNGVGQGEEFFGVPSTRSVGLTLTVVP